MSPKIDSRQSVIDVSTNDSTASATLPTTGIATRPGVDRPRATNTAAPIETSTASATETTRNSSTSSSSLGRITMMAAPSSEPLRVLRPPMITASRNITVNSKL